MAGHYLEAVYYGYKMARAEREGDLEMARRWMAETLRCDPTNPIVRLAASGVCQSLGEPAEAVAQLGIAIALDPQFYPGYYRMAVVLWRQGETTAAEAILKQGWQARLRRDRRCQEGERERWFAVFMRLDQA